MALEDSGAARAWRLLQDNGLDRTSLSELLSSLFAAGGLAVAAVDPSLIGTGQVGENIRCVLRWAGPATDTDELPSSVVIKLPSSDEKSRAAAAATKTYIKEVGFYRDVARSVAMRIPTVHHVTEDRATNRFILIMEDIAPATVGNQLEGCSVEQANLAIDAAAALHGSTWGRTELAELDWIDEASQQKASEHAELLKAVYPGFIDRYQDRLTDEEVAFGEWLRSNADRWFGSRLDRSPADRCLVHGDFRLDNMLFGTDQTAPPLTTVDWQTPSLGNGLGDVAYFLSGSLPAEELRRNQAELLDRYRSRLGDHGVHLDEGRVLTDYRLGAPAGYAMAVIASQLVGQTDRGDEMFVVMAKGSAAQALAVDTQGMLG